MRYQSTEERCSPMDILFGSTPKKEEKKEDETVTPGLETGLEISQTSFTSEFVPLEGPFGHELPHTVSLAELIWSDFEASGCKLITSVRIDRRTGEPGIPINYDMLNKMIVNASRRLPDVYSGTFRILAQTRIRYLAAYQLFMEEKRNTTDSFARGKILHEKQLHIQTNPSIYSKTVADENEKALNELFEECNRLKEQFETYRRNLMRCIYEFIRIKEAVVPYIVRLRAAYLEMQRQYKVKKENERLEKERLQKEKSEKMRLAKEKIRREKAQKAALKEDTATKARKALEAQAWAAYLARSKRLREEGESAMHGRGAKKVNLGN